MKKTISTTVLMAATLQAFAMAGFAERWFEGWVNNLFCASTVAAVQFILICCVFIARNRIKQTPIFRICTRLADKELASIAIGGLLSSLVISAYLDGICGAFFIFSIFPCLLIWILNCLFAFIPKWRKKIASARGILYLGVMTIAIPIAYTFYYYVVRFQWLTSLYSYSYSDKYMPEVEFTIHPTMAGDITAIPFYAAFFFIPWVVCLIVKSIIRLIKNQRGA